MDELEALFNTANCARIERTYKADYIKAIVADIKSSIDNARQEIEAVLQER